MNEYEDDGYDLAGEKSIPLKAGGSTDKVEGYAFLYATKLKEWFCDQILLNGKSHRLGAYSDKVGVKYRNRNRL